MPTILRRGPYRVVFYALEPRGEPPHVHVKRDRSEAKVWLNNGSLVWRQGFSDREIGVILRLVADHREELLDSWHVFFGTR